MVVEGQVMDTMKWQAQPLACEVSDIGHAVYDGADALMLGAATSIGINPVEVEPPSPSYPNLLHPRNTPSCIGQKLLRPMCTTCSMCMPSPFHAEEEANKEEEQEASHKLQPSHKNDEMLQSWQ